MASQAHLVEIKAPPAGRASRARIQHYWLIVTGVLAVIVTPFWIVKYPGMNDYPNHLTRCYILAHYQADPEFQSRYVVVKEPLPNLAIDLIVVPLAHIFPIIVSGKIFLTLTALIYVTGCIWLGYATIGRLNWIAPLAALTFYNSALLWGFVNYLFGIGVFLCAFAFWMQSRSRMSWKRYAICCLLSLIAYISHLSSVVCLGIACSVVALVNWRGHRSTVILIRKLGWLICPAVLIIGFSRSIGDVTTIEWATLTEKIGRLLSPVLTYNVRADAVTLVILLLCIFVMAKRSRIRVPVVAGMILLFFFLITPDSVSSVKSADERYVMPGFLLILLSIQPRWTTVKKAALACATLLMIMRTVEIAVSWSEIDQRQQHVLQMGDNLPRGARIYVVEPTPPKLDRGFRDITNLWTISHHASVSTLFLLRGQQPLQGRQPVCDLLQSHDCLSDYDYIWTYSPTARTEQFVSSVAEPSTHWDSVTLWKIRR